jgi:phycobilisome rod-core linker protein
MALPLLDYKPTTQNQRVSGFGTTDLNEDTPYLYRLEDAASGTEIDALIQSAYRQVFNEQEMLRFNRQIALETQLKNRAIAVKDFIRGLAKSERFYEMVVAPNNNYRLVEICFKRFLGRSPYNQEEEIAWSIIIATQGWSKFVDALIDSEEYLRSFGENTVPYQRQRKADRPFSFTPRYGANYRDQLPQPRPYTAVERFKPVFEQFEPFDWHKLQQQSNWSVVTGLAIVSSGLLVFLFALAAWANAAGN